MYSTRYYICRILRTSFLPCQNGRTRTKIRETFLNATPETDRDSDNRILCNTYHTFPNSLNPTYCNCGISNKTISNAFFCSRTFSSALFTPSSGDKEAYILKPELNFEVLLTKIMEIEDTVQLRKINVQPQKVLAMWKEIQRLEGQKTELEGEKKKNKFSKKDKITEEDRQKAKARGKDMREELRSIKSRITELTEEMYPMALSLPNFLHKDVPRGDKPVELDSFTGHGGEVQKLKYMKKASHQLVHPGFVYLEGECALLEQALLSWASHQLHKEGFTRYSSPDMYKPIALRFNYSVVKAEAEIDKIYQKISSEAVGIEPEDCNQTYTVRSHDDTSHLAGSSPMAFAAYFMTTVLEAINIPQRCFTVGKHYNSTHDSGEFDGLHKSFQTNTVEVCGLCEESTASSNMLYNQYVNILKDLYSALPLNFRLMEIPVLGLLPSMYRKCALQVWLPNTAEYAEVASVYNCTDYISRRLKIRHLGSNDEMAALASNRRFVHTVHGTFLDTGVLLEAFQQLSKNQVEFAIPDTILPYMPRSSMTSFSDS